MFRFVESPHSPSSCLTRSRRSRQNKLSSSKQTIVLLTGHVSCAINIVSRYFDHGLQDGRAVQVDSRIRSHHNGSLDIQVDEQLHNHRYPNSSPESQIFSLNKAHGTRTTLGLALYQKPNLHEGMHQTQKRYGNAELKRKNSPSFTRHPPLMIDSSTLLVDAALCTSQQGNASKSSLISTPPVIVAVI